MSTCIIQKAIDADFSIDIHYFIITTYYWLLLFLSDVDEIWDPQ